MKHVFLSYSRKDSALAEAVMAHLVKANRNIWQDAQKLRAGGKTSDLEKAIDTSSVFLCLVSPHYRDSIWCMNELSRAIRKQLPIVGVIVGATEKPIHLEWVITLTLSANAEPQEIATVAEAIDLGIQAAVGNKRKKSPTGGRRTGSKRQSASPLEEASSIIQQITEEVSHVVKTASPDLHPVMMRLWDMLKQLNNTHADVFRDYASSEEFAHAHRVLHEAQGIFEGGDELTSLHKLIADSGLQSSEKHLGENPGDWNNRWWDAVDRESAILNELATLQQPREFAMVGPGALSHTLLRFHRSLPEIACVGVDHDKTAVAEAQKACQRLKIKNIAYRFQRGEIYDYSSSNLVFVANMVSPKRKVLNQIAITAHPGTVVVVRTPKLFGGLIYETAEYRDTSRLTFEREYDWMEWDRWGIFKTMVLRVKANPW